MLIEPRIAAFRLTALLVAQFMAPVLAALATGRLTGPYLAQGGLAVLSLAYLLHGLGLSRGGFNPGRLFFAWGLSVITLLALGDLSQVETLFRREAIYLWLALGYPMLVVADRFAVWLESHMARPAVLLVGAGPTMDLLWHRLGNSNLSYCAWLPEDAAHQLSATAVRHLDHVYVSGTLMPEVLARVVEVFRDSTVSLHLVPDTHGIPLLRPGATMCGSIPVVSLQDTPFIGVSGLVKRAEDLLLGAVALVLVLPVMALIAVLVKLTSRGPVLFRQRRYGLNGESIRVLKFRTMTVAEDGEVVDQARRVDPRVTGFGRWLRKTSLDELPQLFNVLGGSMSLVGPRPHAVSHNEYYRSRIEGYMLRHKVKPGITGLAQVSGYRGETETLDKMQGRVTLDLRYLQDWSLVLDLYILARTPFSLFGRGVY